MRSDMDINAIISTLGSLRAYSADNLKADPESENRDIWQQDVQACETAIGILAALTDEGISDLAGTMDMLQDYRALAKQCRVMHLKFEVAAHPTHKDGVWHCPACNSRVATNHTHCHRCGKMLGWGAK